MAARMRPRFGIGGEERGLDQRRVADGVADALAFLAIPAALHGDGDELGRSFAVADDGLCEFNAPRRSSAARKAAYPGCGGIVANVHAGPSRGNHDE